MFVVRRPGARDPWAICKAWTKYSMSTRVAARHNHVATEPRPTPAARAISSVWKPPVPLDRTASPVNPKNARAAVFARALREMAELVETYGGRRETALGLAGAGDLRLIRSNPPRGAGRIARHLWRMSFALFTAAMSFFVGQAKVIPEPIRIRPLLALPVLAVLITMLYWLWRLRIRRSLGGIVRVTAVEAA